MLRLLLAYRNKLEYQYGYSASSDEVLTILIFTLIGDIFRFSLGDTIAYISSFEFNNLKYDAVRDNNGKLIHNYEYIYGIRKSLMVNIINSFFCYVLIIASIIIVLILLSLLIINYLNLYLCNIIFLQYIFINCFIKLILILNAFFRSVGDRFGQSYISVYAASVQCLLPVFIYYILINQYSLSITFPIIIICAFIGNVTSLIMNFLNVCYIYRQYIVPVFHKTIFKYLLNTLQVLPGSIVNAIITFSFVELIMFTTPFVINQDIKLDLLLAYKPFRNMYGMILLPFSISFNLIAVRAKNNNILINTLYTTSVIIMLFGAIGIAVFIHTKCYIYVFYLRQELQSHIINGFLYIFPLKLLEKSLETLNMLNGSNKLYSFMVVVRDVGGIFIFNLLYYLGISNSISVVLLYTLLLQSIISNIINISIYKYYDVKNCFQIRLLPIFILVLYVVFFASYLCTTCFLRFFI